MKPYSLSALHYGWVILVLATLVAFGALGLARFGYSIVLPAMQVHLGMDNTQAGVLAAVHVVGYLVASLLGSGPHPPFIRARFLVFAPCQWAPPPTSSPSPPSSARPGPKRRCVFLSLPPRVPCLRFRPNAAEHFRSLAPDHATLAGQRP